MFSLVSGLPSTISAGGLPLLFDCFVGTMPLYDSPPPCMWVLWLIAFSHRSAALPPRTATGVSRFSRMEFLCMHGVSDSAGPRRTRAIAPRVVAFRLAGHRRLPDSQISELNTQPTYAPVQRFKCSLTTALAWLGVRMVRYSFPV